MAEYQPSRELVLSALNDHRPKSNREIVEATGLSHSSVCNALALCWRRGLVLRTAQPIYEHERVFKERGGLTQTTRPYHLYLHKPEELDSTAIEGDRFVGYDPKHLDARGGGKISKAQRILIFIQAHRDKASFSAEIADALADEDVNVRDVMSNIRRFEVKGPVYVRGYKTGERQTPFKRGYLITWLDPQKPREEAIEEAIQWTDGALEGKISSSPFTERIHRVLDMIIKHSKLRKLVRFTYKKKQRRGRPSVEGHPEHLRAHHNLCSELQVGTRDKETCRGLS